MKNTTKMKSLSVCCRKVHAPRHDGSRAAILQILVLKVDPRTNRVIVMGALDNLVKGAAGQAVQNMNLLFGLKEDMGLELVPLFP